MTKPEPEPESNSDEGVAVDPNSEATMRLVHGVLQALDTMDLDVGQQLAVGVRLVYVLARYVLVEGERVGRVEDNRAALLATIDELRMRIEQTDPKEVRETIAGFLHQKLTAEQKPGRA